MLSPLTVHWFSTLDGLGEHKLDYLYRKSNWKLRFRSAQTIVYSLILNQIRHDRIHDGRYSVQKTRLNLVQRKTLSSVYHRCRGLRFSLLILSYCAELHADVDLAKPSGQQPSKSKPSRCNRAVKEQPYKTQSKICLALYSISSNGQ